MNTKPIARGLTALAVAAAALVTLNVRAQEAQRLLEDYGTSITVYGERLPLKEREILDTAASIAVITREDIQASGATTVQQVLSELPGITLHNETGNPAESTVDLRGFPQGTSLAVFLDGVRLNDVQDNSVQWDLIPLEDVERIEVYRGASGPLYGGGALAGVVNIITRRNPGFPRLDLKSTLGSFGEREARIHTSGASGPVEFYGTAMKRHAAGWRQNDGYKLDDGLFRLNLTLPRNQSLAALFQYSGDTVSQPGSLTAAEIAADPRQSPFNLYDGTRGKRTLASLRYNVSMDGGWAFSAQAYTRRQDRDTLTTGRFGSGFFTRGSERLSGATAEARNAWKLGGAILEFSAGAEGSGGRFDGSGFYTNTTGGDKVPASRTGVRENLSGAYLQGDLGLGALHFIAGARTDRAAYDYTDRMNPANDTRRVFRQSTWRAGALYHFGQWSSAFLTYSQGYRIPSVIDLFAYPGFYSNPDLSPTRAGDWEAGWRYLKDGNRFKVTVYDMSMRDEVVFVLTQPAYFIGQNRNVGRSYRRGLEADAHMRLPAGFALFAGGSYQDSEVTAGPYSGNRVPMVPRYQGTAGVFWSNPSWTVQLAGNWVGPQLLDNDLTNSQPGIPGYATVDLSARFAYRALTLEASASNLLDHAYVNRGITNGSQDFYTPAYPAAFRFSVMWSF